MERDRIMWKVFLVLLEADVQKERETDRIIVHDKKPNFLQILISKVLFTKLNNLAVKWP